MTFERFLEAHYHEVFGLVAEAATAGRRSGELSLWLSEAGRTLKKRLRLMFDEISRAEAILPAAVTQQRKAGV